jgi:hypothetical protein
VGSSLIEGVAIDDLDVRSIDVLGNLLLLRDVLLESSALVLRAICGWPPSRLRGRYRMPLPFGAAFTRLGVTLPSMKAEDCDTLLTWVGVMGVETL